MLTPWRCMGGSLQFFVYLCIVHKLSFSIVREFKIITVYANLSIKIGGIPFVNKLVSHVGV